MKLSQSLSAFCRMSISFAMAAAISLNSYGGGRSPAFTLAQRASRVWQASTFQEQAMASESAVQLEPPFGAHSHAVVAGLLEQEQLPSEKSNLRTHSLALFDKSAQWVFEHPWRTLGLIPPLFFVVLVSSLGMPHVKLDSADWFLDGLGLVSRVAFAEGMALTISVFSFAPFRAIAYVFFPSSMRWEGRSPAWLSRVIHLFKTTLFSWPGVGVTMVVFILWSHLPDYFEGSSDMGIYLTFIAAVYLIVGSFLFPVGRLFAINELRNYPTREMIKTVMRTIALGVIFVLPHAFFHDWWGHAMAQQLFYSGYHGTLSWRLFFALHQAAADMTFAPIFGWLHVSAEDARFWYAFSGILVTIFYSLGLLVYSRYFKAQSFVRRSMELASYCVSVLGFEYLYGSLDPFSGPTDWEYLWRSGWVNSVHMAGLVVLFLPMSTLVFRAYSEAKLWAQASPRKRIIHVDSLGRVRTTQV